MSDATTEDLLDVDPESATMETVDFELVRHAVREGEGLVRDRAAAILLALTDNDPESVLPAIPAIVAGIESDHVNVTSKMLSAAIILTDDHVDALEPLVEPLLTCLTDALPRTQAFAAKAIGPIAEAHPEWLTPYPDRLLAVIQMEVEDPLADAPESQFEQEGQAEQYQAVTEEAQKQQFMARSVAAHLLLEVVEVDPDIGNERIDELLTILETADATVTIAIVDIFAAVGEVDPIAIEPAVDPLIELLQHPSEQVQARVVKALGFSGDERAIEPLERLAADDEVDPELQELAAETADWIESEVQY